MATYFLQLDSSATTAWNPLTPVLLPVGPLTTSSVLSASMGVFIPFLLFLIAFFNYLYSLWNSNNAADLLGGGKNAAGGSRSGGDSYYSDESDSRRAPIALTQTASFIASAPPRSQFGNGGLQSRTFFPVEQ